MKAICHDNLQYKQNTFQSSISLIKNDFHAFASLGVAKGTKSQKQQKRAMLNNRNRPVPAALFGMMYRC
jgi:hypothetical protein